MDKKLEEINDNLKEVYNLIGKAKEGLISVEVKQQILLNTNALANLKIIFENLSELREAIHESMI